MSRRMDRELGPRVSRLVDENNALRERYIDALRTDWAHQKREVESDWAIEKSVLSSDVDLYKERLNAAETERDDLATALELAKAAKAIPSGHPSAELLKNIGRFRRGEVEGVEAPAWGRPALTVMQTPLGGYVRAIAENAGATPEVAHRIEQGGAGLLATGIGGAGLLAALDTLLDDRSPDELPLGY